MAKLNEQILRVWDEWEETTGADANNPDDFVAWVAARAPWRRRSAPCRKSDSGPRNPDWTTRHTNIGERRKRPGRIVLGRTGAAGASRLFCAGPWVGHRRHTPR